MCDKYRNMIIPRMKNIVELQCVSLSNDVKSFSDRYIYENGLDFPLLFRNDTRSSVLLKLKLPKANSLEDIAKIIGDDFPVKVF